MGNEQALTMTELLRRADGCTDQSCPYHGVVNREIARRRLLKDTNARYWD